MEAFRFCEHIGLVYSGTLSPFIKVGTWEIGKSLGRKASCQVHTEYGPKRKLGKGDYFHNRSPLFSEGRNLGMGPEFQGHKPQDGKPTWHSGHTRSLMLNRQLLTLPIKLHINFKRFLLVLEKSAYKFSFKDCKSWRFGSLWSFHRTVDNMFLSFLEYYLWKEFMGNLPFWVWQCCCCCWCCWRKTVIKRKY